MVIFTSSQLLLTTLQKHGGLIGPNRSFPRNSTIILKMSYVRGKNNIWCKIIFCKFDIWKMVNMRFYFCVKINVMHLGYKVCNCILTFPYNCLFSTDWQVLLLICDKMIVLTWKLYSSFSWFSWYVAFICCSCCSKILHTNKEENYNNHSLYQIYRITQRTHPYY